MTTVPSQVIQCPVLQNQRVLDEGPLVSTPTSASLHRHGGLGCLPSLGKSLYPGEMTKSESSREGCALEAGLCGSQSSSVLLVHSDYVVQFEEDQFQPGVWHDHSKFPGSVNSAVLHLSPYVNYQFRVIAVNEVGSSHPSLPSERYRTSGARECLSPGFPEFPLTQPSSQPWGPGSLLAFLRPSFVTSETE